MGQGGERAYYINHCRRGAVVSRRLRDEWLCQVGEWQLNNVVWDACLLSVWCYGMGVAGSIHVVAGRGRWELAALITPWCLSVLTCYCKHS